MLDRFLKLTLLGWLLALPVPVLAGAEHITRAEFEQLARDLADKVDLFRDVWANHPEAEFYGGSTRDYLYWVKNKLKSAPDRESTIKLAADLRRRPIIEAREFITGESDIDILSSHKVVVDPKRYGVKAIDSKSIELTDATSYSGASERLQGYLPAEKIRLRKIGFVAPADLGDGLGEIHRGVFKGVFTPEAVFNTSNYAKAGQNHQILLALRYLRLLSTNYFNAYGRGYPDRQQLLAAADPESLEQVKKIISRATKSGELARFFENEKFTHWLNASIQKAFRSYTNPDAALMLTRELGVDKLQETYAGKILPFNQLVFAYPPDDGTVAKNLKTFKVSENLFESPEKYFPDGYIYHGTEEKHFRNMVLQGVIPSSGGSAGPGLYGAGQKNRLFAENYRSQPQSAVRLKVKPDARIVDITKGEGKKLFRAFGKSESEFARAFGIDILLYPYSVEVFVVKNGNALHQAEGVYKMIRPIGDVIEFARKSKDIGAIAESLSLGSFRADEIKIVWENMGLSESEIIAQLKNPPSPASRESLKKFFRDYVDPYLDLSKHYHDNALTKAVLEFGANGADMLGHELARGPLLDRPDLIKAILENYSVNSYTSGNLIEGLTADLLADPRWKKSPLLPLLFEKVPFRGDVIPFLASLPREVSYAPRMAIFARQIEDRYQIDNIIRNPSWWNDDLAFLGALIDKMDHVDYYADHLWAEAKKHKAWIGSDAEFSFLTKLKSPASFWKKNQYDKLLTFEQIAERIPYLMKQVYDDHTGATANYLLDIFFRDPRSVNYPAIFGSALKGRDNFFLSGLADIKHWRDLPGALEQAMRASSYGVSENVAKFFLQGDSAPVALQVLAIENANGGYELENTYSELVRNRPVAKEVELAYIKKASSMENTWQLKLNSKPALVAWEVIRNRVNSGLTIEVDHGRTLLEFVLGKDPTLLDANAQFLLDHLESQGFRRSSKNIFSALMHEPKTRIRADVADKLLEVMTWGENEGSFYYPLSKLSPEEIAQIPWLRKKLADGSIFKIEESFHSIFRQEFIKKVFATPDLAEVIYDSDVPEYRYIKYAPESKQLELAQRGLLKGRLVAPETSSLMKGLLEDSFQSGKYEAILANPLAEDELKLAFKRLLLSSPEWEDPNKFPLLKEKLRRLDPALAGMPAPPPSGMPAPPPSKGFSLPSCALRFQTLMNSITEKLGKKNRN